MKKEVILELFEKFEQACYIYNDIECWSAREVQEILGYTKWVNFLNVIDKAKKACENAGSSVSDHFADFCKMVTLAKGRERQLENNLFRVRSQRIPCYVKLISFLFARRCRIYSPSAWYNLSPNFTVCIP